MVDPITRPFRTDLIGDDAPFNTLRYSEVPEGYRISDIVLDGAAYPLLSASKETLDAIAERFYKNYEIVGETIAEFFEHLQISLIMKADTFEAFLGATEKLAIPNKSSQTIYKPGTTLTNEQLTDSETKNINVPFDDGDNDQPSNRSLSKAGKTQTQHMGEDNTEYIDNDFNTLTEFLRNNPSIQQEYVQIFRENFTLRQQYKW